MTFYQKELERMRHLIYSNKRQIKTVVAVKNYIDAHYNRNINLDMLSRIQLVSKYHLLRLFKIYYGITPRQYLIEKRIEQSKTHLKSGMLVTDACFAVGFESLGSFSKLFKVKTGKCPSKFQKEQVSRNNLKTDC